MLGRDGCSGYGVRQCEISLGGRGGDGCRGVLLKLVEKYKIILREIERIIILSKFIDWKMKTNLSLLLKSVRLVL